MRLDVAWSSFETRLCVIVLALQIFALSAWIILKGMSSPPDSGSPAGAVFRAILGGFALGMAGYWGLRKQSTVVRNVAACIGIVAGVYLARFWAKTGVDYTSNLLNWYQQASSLTLFGGLRGVGTRLTLLLALLGGSLATGAGKHITIDVVTRFLKPKARVPVVVIGWIGAAVVCLSSAWGFFDHIAIENFGAKADARAGKKVSLVIDELGDHWFMLRKQVALDLKSTPRIVFKGERYADWLTGNEWNAWITESGLATRFGKKKAHELIEARAEKDERAPSQIASALGKDETEVAAMSDAALLPVLSAAFEKEYTTALQIEPSDRRAPIIVVPGKGEPRGELVHAANLVFPIGLLIIALRFLLRALLVVGGHASADPDATDDHFASDDDPSAAGLARGSDPPASKPPDDDPPPGEAKPDDARDPPSDEAAARQDGTAGGESPGADGADDTAPPADDNAPDEDQRSAEKEEGSSPTRDEQEEKA